MEQGGRRVGLEMEDGHILTLSKTRETRLQIDNMLGQDNRRLGEKKWVKKDENWGR